MRKAFLILGALLAIIMPSFCVVGIASAFDPFGQACEETNSAGICKDNQEGANPLSTGNNGLLDQIITVLFLIAGVIAVIMIIVGGFQFVTSSGDSSKAAKGRTTLIYAVVGLVVVMMSATIVRFMVNKLTG